MATKTVQYQSTSSVAATRQPVTWYVVLHLVDGKVLPQLDWSRQMQVGDHVRFLSPDGVVQVKFTPELAKDANGNPVLDVPFGTDNTVVRGPDNDILDVKNSCKALMTCSLIKDGVVYTWKGPLALGAPHDEWTKEGYAEGGTHVCTGGGGNPVVC